MNKRISIASFYLAVFLLLPSFAFALNDISTIIDNVVNMLLWPIFLGAVIIMLIWAGFLFVLAKGEPGKIETAKKAVLWTIIGIGVALLAFSVVPVIKDLIGV